MNGTRTEQQAKRIAELLARIDKLEDRIAELEDELMAPLPDFLCGLLTGTEARVARVIASRQRARKEAILAIAWGRNSEDIDPKIVDVIVCRLRKKLAPFGIKIQTIVGVGYTFDPVSRQRLDALAKGVVDHELDKLNAEAGR